MVGVMADARLSFGANGDTQLYRAGPNQLGTRSSLKLESTYKQHTHSVTVSLAMHVVTA